MDLKYENLYNRNKEKSSSIEPFDRIEQNPRKYIPNIPSVKEDMKKNNYPEDKTNFNLLNNNENEIEKNNAIKSSDLLDSQAPPESNNNKDYLVMAKGYWETFKNNKTVSTIINPFQDDSQCINTFYKIYSCITITLVLIVIILSITLS